MKAIIITALITAGFASGCTSLGHESRAIPQIEKRLQIKPERVIFSGSGELAIAVELLLASKGIEVLYAPTQSNSDNNKNPIRYSISATSVDHDTCIPEGSRQMHFYISVVDLISNERIYAMSGDFGCKNTITRKFEQWLTSK